MYISFLFGVFFVEHDDDDDDDDVVDVDVDVSSKTVSIMETCGMNTFITEFGPLGNPSNQPKRLKIAPNQHFQNQREP